MNNFKNYVLTDRWAREFKAEIDTPGRHEPSSVQYWRRVFLHFFKEQEYDIPQQVAPTVALSIRRRGDLSVQAIFPNGKRFKFFWFEGAKGEASLQKICEIEVAARDLCASSCEEDDEDHCFAGTAFGTRARFWRYDRADPGPAAGDTTTSVLFPLFGLHTFGDREQYIDLEDEVLGINAGPIEQALQHIKDYSVLKGTS